MRPRALDAVVLAAALLAVGCPPNNPAPDAADARTDATRPMDARDGAADAPAPPDAPPGDVPADAPPAGTRCRTAFEYRPPAGRNVTRVAVTGEFSGWMTPGLAMASDGRGGFRGEVDLPPGLHAYKLLIDGNWELDPGARRRKYVDGTENSAVLVRDCSRPQLTLVTHTAERPAVGAGRLRAQVRFAPGLAGDAIDPASVRAQLRHDGATRPVSGVTVDAATQQLTLDVPMLADGKYTALVEARDRAGREAAPLRVVFWIEAERFDWRGAVIYMAMVDRFANGEPSNDARPTAGVDPRADFQGGDFQGLRARIADGTLDRLGVRAIWIAPVNRNPDASFVASDGVHQVMGYHGYWPVRAREVDPRLGGEAALTALVSEAHAHGIRVLQDFVVNHVHRDHEYMRAHPEWFRTGCVCGTDACDWTARRLDCLFTSYLPDVNWSVPAVSEQFADDAAFWIDRFDMDGLRVDAVKHVEDIAVYNLRARLADEFEASGLRVFLTGETAMGWNDCGLDCNRGEYDTISRYIGPNALDGQADFVLYHAVPYRAFSADQRGMLHVDYWTQQSLAQYPAGAVMTAYVGSHDTPRFVTLGTYRGQSPAFESGVPFRQWDNVAAAPVDGEPYVRHRLGLSWLLTTPGAPLLYYGDEYGEWGGADPNNRRMWRGGDAGALSADEQATLAHVRALGAARRELAALRTGGYRSLHATEDTLVFARAVAGTPRAVAVVGITRAGSAQTATVSLAPEMLPEGTVLRDRMGGPDRTVSGGMLTLTVPARGTVLLAP